MAALKHYPDKEVPVYYVTLAKRVIEEGEANNEISLVDETDRFAERLAVAINDFLKTGSAETVDLSKKKFG